MKKIRIVVTSVTLYLILFVAAPFILIPDQVVYGMYALSPLLVIYMVLVILKNGTPSKHTFDDRFYDDYDYKRNGVE